jgi:chorismate dehydratase
MLRIGAVSYLNTKPLICGLRERLNGLGELSLNLPSRLADDLKSDSLDVALVPSIEFFRGLPQGYRVISDAAIACRGPVWSVRLLSRVPVSQIRKLALDEGSRTSAAMIRILLSECYGLLPETVPLTMEQDPESVDADAVLIIGDRAMHPPAGVYEEIWDLGERWCQATGLPFVFALWVARKDLGDLSELKSVLEDSRNEGLMRIDEIAQREAGPHGLTVTDLVRYFSHHLHFKLGPRELDGLELYRQKAAKLGLLDVSSRSSLGKNVTTATHVASTHHLTD